MLFNRPINHSAARAPSRSTSPLASLSDHRAASLLLDETSGAVMVTVSRRQNSVKAWKQEEASPDRAAAQAALYGDSVSDVSMELARERRLPASCWQGRGGEGEEEDAAR